MQAKKHKTVLARVGCEAMRARLLETLDQHRWSLSAASRELEIHPSELIKALKRLAPSEYLAAKESGRIRLGCNRLHPQRGAQAP